MLHLLKDLLWMCHFVEFCREVTDTQMPQVAPVILPEMYKIFTQDQVSQSARKYTKSVGDLVDTF